MVVVADPDLRERMRCIRVVAEQTPVSAIGAATWLELEQVLSDAPDVGLLLYTHPLAGSPEDAIDQLLARTKRLVLVAGEDEHLYAPSGLARAVRPLAEEALVVMARALSSTTSSPPVSFVPVDFLQMICMSDGSHVLVLSHADADVGVIEVRSGQVWTAFDALGVGEDAFARLIRPEMRARVSAASGSLKERTIFKALHGLVLESLRRIDEGDIALPPPLSPDKLEATLSTPEQLAARVRQLNDDARKLLMARNYDEAARVLGRLAELDPSSHLVRANLEQLRRLGFPK